MIDPETVIFKFGWKADQTITKYCFSGAKVEESHS